MGSDPKRRRPAVDLPISGTSEAVAIGAGTSPVPALRSALMAFAAAAAAPRNAKYFRDLVLEKSLRDFSRECRARWRPAVAHPAYRRGTRARSRTRRSASRNGLGMRGPSQQR